MGHADPPPLPLDGPVLAFVEACRSATLATLAKSGRARLVPVCFTVGDDGTAIYTPLDEKPKRGADPLSLARVRDVRRRDDVTLLFERWSEDWSELAWVRLTGRAELLEPAADEERHRAAVRGLRARYAQYQGQRLEDRPMLRIAVDEVTTWSASGSY